MPLKQHNKGTFVKRNITGYKSELYMKYCAELNRKSTLFVSGGIIKLFLFTMDFFHYIK